MSTSNQTMAKVERDLAEIAAMVERDPARRAALAQALASIAQVAFVAGQLAESEKAIARMLAA